MHRRSQLIKTTKNTGNKVAPSPKVVVSPQPVVATALAAVHPHTDKKPPPPKECKLDLEVGCITLTPSCPCFSLNKCIEIGGACADAIGSECGGGDAPKLSCGCSGGKHLTSCALRADVPDTDKHPPPPPTPKCCNKAAFCVYTGDSISGNYSVTVTQQGDESTIFASNLTIKNPNDQSVTVGSLTVTVLQGGQPLPNSSTTQNLSPALVLQPGQSATIPFAGAFVLPDGACNPGAPPLVLQVTVKTTSPSQTFTTTSEFSCTDVPNCEITERCLTDENSGFEPLPIPVPLPEGEVIVDIPFGPVVIDEEACGVAIQNQAKLLPFACGTEPPVCPPFGEQGAVLSNTTEIVPTCSLGTIGGTATARCESSQQWCICKTGNAFTADQCVLDNFPSNQFAEYTITSTLVNEQETVCTLSVKATLDLDCALPYDKIFRIAVDDVATGDVTLPAGETSIVIVDTTIQLPPGEFPPPTVTVTATPYLADFNLSTCEVTQSEVLSDEYLSITLPVTVVNTNQTVFLTDAVTAQPGNQLLVPINVDGIFLPDSPCYELLGATLNDEIVTDSTEFTFDQVFGGLFSVQGIDLTALPFAPPPGSGRIILRYVVNVPPGVESVKNNAALTITRNDVVADMSTASVSLLFNPPVPPANQPPRVILANANAKPKAFARTEKPKAKINKARVAFGRRK